MIRLLIIAALAAPVPASLLRAEHDALKTKLSAARSKLIKAQAKTRHASRAPVPVNVAVPSGVWVDGEPRPCPGPRDYGSAGRGGLKLAGGCIALAPGVWVRLDAQRDVYVEVAALRAERDALKAELEATRAELVKTQIEDASHLAACRSALDLAGTQMSAPCVCPSQWQAVTVGALGGAVGGAGLIFGVMK